MTKPALHSASHASRDETHSTRDAWQPRTADIRESVVKYSRFVSTMKILLPAVAVFLMALVLILPQLRDEQDQFSVDIIPAEYGSGDTLSLVNARYFGTDESGQAFSVTAKFVREASGAGEKIDLIEPQADISLNDGSWLMVGAETGQYHRESQVLDLQGMVNLFQDQGYEIHTDSATVLLKEGKAHSFTPVRTQGPFGQLESQGFELVDKGKVVYFTGPARLVLNSGSAGAAAP